MHNNLNSLIDSIKIMYFMNMKDSNNYTTFIMLSLITLLTFVINNDNIYIKFENFIVNFVDVFSIFGCKKSNKIILEGKRCLKMNSFMTKTDNLFSDRFLSFWHYISKNNLNNPTINEIKEYANSSNIYDDYGDPINSKRNKSNFTGGNSNDIFVVHQKYAFKLNDDIYCKVNYEIDKPEDKKKIELENIFVEIYSYKLSLEKLTEFLDTINDNYKKELEKIRNNKKFIYTLIGQDKSNHNNYNNDEMVNVWEECEFISTRTFNNLFFDQKKNLINKINFYIDNRQWYEYEGHPYTFGLGLHGPPGTGKTSIIKCIANKLNRHIIVIPLNKIKTQREFSQYFFENYYNRANSNKIDFSDKIIVFEDIDCMTNIVKKRNVDNDENNNDTALSIENNAVIQNKLLNKIAKKMDDDHVDNLIVDLDKSNNDKITLSYILNIIDGIRETPGRILIITSNNYNSLDPALIRPGRIDMTLEMKNASIDVIKEMYNHYYNDIIPEEVESELKDYIISPAKIINLRLENDKKEDFLSSLKKEFK